MAEIKTIRKNLDLTEDTIKALSIQAIEKGFSSFKIYAQHLLAEQAKSTKVKNTTSK